MISTSGTYIGITISKKRHNYQFPENEYQLYKELLTRVQNDHKIVDRLIKYEQTRAPQAGREELLKNALQRWMRDNRL